MAAMRSTNTLYPLMVNFQQQSTLLKLLSFSHLLVLHSDHTA